MNKRGTLISLQNLSKNELIELVKEKFPSLAEFNYEEKGSISKKTKPERLFEPSEYENKMVALKIAYFGFKYQGFASQTGLLNIFNDVKLSKPAADTVEDHLFRAMIKTRLILDPLTCNYSRCGRTDSGVSSTGQVIALKLRVSNRKLSDPKALAETIDYVNVINKQLPDDIRVLDWAIVPDNFSARFSCSSRLYHYYFSKIHYDRTDRTVTNLNIEKMQEAARLLVGVHDFRNFCKRDPSKPDQTFTREILECSIEKSDSTDGFYKFICKGSAFLYHQIRCIMSILFMIGTEKEPVDLVRLMLDKLEPKVRLDGPIGPLVHYEIASGIPLTLHECYYEKPGSESINWNTKLNEDGFPGFDGFSRVNAFLNQFEEVKMKDESDLIARHIEVRSELEREATPFLADKAECPSMNLLLASMGLAESTNKVDVATVVLSFWDYIAEFSLLDMLAALFSVVCLGFGSLYLLWKMNPFRGRQAK